MEVTEPSIYGGFHQGEEGDLGILDFLMVLLRDAARRGILMVICTCSPLLSLQNMVLS